ncbi:hypothetical protein HF313_19525 [Massilia atriviolacea]|uniref:Uncharacterized protein n=1 Tax=Massilia atriviolacea TaxID=2495579 RepID=A0A430HSK8_9BURK|nr:hypothetical protein [Massilia atriviolacea]RSZ60506.1 hypothetical protein EJB06_05175 [Massilia atriviolacea]
MEYRLSLTPRLVALGLFASVALLVLLFALGFQLGQGMARSGVPADAAAAKVRAAVQAKAAP